jgi:hypothetical protein
VPRNGAQQERAKGRKKVRYNGRPKEAQRQTEEAQDHGARNDKYAHAKCNLANGTNKRVRTSDFFGKKVTVDVETQICDHGYYKTANRETQANTHKRPHGRLLPGLVI